MRKFNASASDKPIAREIIDSVTGQIYEVLSTTTRGGVETLVITTSELPLEVNDVTRKSNNHKFPPKYFCGYRGMTKIMIDGLLSQRETKVLGFLIENMPWGNRIQVSQCVIADSLGIARSHVSNAIKGLKEKMIIIEDVNALVPNVPYYLIDPEVAFNGAELNQEFARKKFGRVLKKTSDANKPSLKIVK